MEIPILVVNSDLQGLYHRLQTETRTDVLFKIILRAAMFFPRQENIPTL
jgi:hypothetical protein